jgi:hypothetical protein
MAGIEQLEIHSKVCSALYRIVSHRVASRRSPVSPSPWDAPMALLRQLLTGCRLPLFAGLHRALGQGRCRPHDIMERTTAQEINVTPTPDTAPHLSSGRRADPVCTETLPSLNTQGPAAPTSRPSPTTSLASSSTQTASPSRSRASSPSEMSAPHRTSSRRRASFP